MKDVVLMLEKDKLVEDPPCPFSEFNQAFTPWVDLEVTPRKNIKREWSYKMELDPTNPQNIIAGPTNESVARSDGGVALSQLKSNKRKAAPPQSMSNKLQARSPNMLEENLATLEPNKGMKFCTTDLVGKTTALKHKDLILQWIAKDEAVKIGVYGMGGVGKTTIFKHVHNQLLLEPNHFDKIIYVTVPKDGNITKLQIDLAKELDFKLSSDDDEDRRSRLLLRAFEKRKRFVIFFDDMWTEISIDKMGIPEPTQENGCKLLLTSRKFDVCQRMGCHEKNTILVKPLQEDEALELFMKYVDCVLAPDVQKIAEMVAKKCFGLPLAIITVGRAMKGNSNISNWRVALNDLNLIDPSRQSVDIEDSVYECLKFSFDRLENEMLRKCFLCCALYPEGWPILRRGLVDFWITEGIVEGTDRQDELDKGQCAFNKLKDHCLLDTFDDMFDDECDEISDGVKLHDLIRDMALRLTKKCFMVKTYNSNLEKLQNAEEWNSDLERVSFMHSPIKSLSITPICPKLSTLVVGSSFLKNVAFNFFLHMKCLKVLDLRCFWVFPNYSLKSLPDSISDLVNLRALRLSWYKKLKKLPSLAKLVLLRTLELNNTGVEELPEGMEMLVNLRCLNLHVVPLKKRIPRGLISKFSLLRELYLGGIEVDKVYAEGRGKSFAKELLSLKELENLNVSFHYWSDYARYVGSSKFNGLKYYFLAMGQERLFDNEQFLGPSPRSTITLFHQPVKRFPGFFLPQTTKRVEIIGNHGLIRLSELGWLIKGVEKLVAILIVKCNKIECIWSSKDGNQESSATGTSSTCWIRSLENICIGACPKLFTTFEGISISSGVFCLKKLEIYFCDNLKNVFLSSRFLQLLPNLEVIKIKGCDKIEELIGDEEENKNTETPIAIPRLKKLSISELPKLKRIWMGVMICDSLKCVKVVKCLDLKRLPQFMGEEQSTTPPTLLSIKGSKGWWSSLEWDPVYPKHILEPFFKEKRIF